MYLRVGDEAFSTYLGPLQSGLPIFVVAAALSFQLLKLYRGLWRYASFRDLISVFYAISLAVLRREDPKILEGAAKYFDDLAIDGLLHVVFVRSTIAHAEITAVDLSDAVGLPGVVGVYSGDDLDLAPIQGFVMLPPLSLLLQPTVPRSSASASVPTVMRVEANQGIRMNAVILPRFESRLLSTCIVPPSPVADNPALRESNGSDCGRVG